MKKTRVLLLACASLLTLAATRPAKSDDCLTGYFCANCDIATPVPEKRLCKETICNGVAVLVSCDPCSIRCILPPG
ncbi:MAG TPA: hypothetical protein VGS07_27355 [Thermoanaerobaculia bacterium]|nr:hypothetical protein [Thermoanaerobaculia bacterium]